MKQIENKTGQAGGVWALVGVGVAFVVVAIVLAFGQSILADIKGDFTADTLEYNSTVSGQEAVSKMSSKLPLVATIIIAVIIIGLLIAGFMRGQQ